MSIDIEQFSYVPKLVALIDLYVELSLPLAAALRAAEADLGSWPTESSLPFWNRIGVTLPWLNG